MIVRDFNKLPNRGSRRGKDYRSSILTERFLSMMLRVVANPSYNKVKKLQNIQKFTDTIPINKYEKDPNVYALIVSVKNVLRNKLEGAVDLQDLVEFVNIELADNFSEIKENLIFPNILSAEEATERDENLVTNTVNTYLRCDSIFKNKDTLSDILTDIGSGNIASLDDTLNDFEQIIGVLHDNFESTKNGSGGIKMFHTTDDSFKDTFNETFDYVNSNKMVLKTGLKRLNRMLSTVGDGGFLGGNSYIFYADTNTFKSALLRWIDFWIVKYNSNMFQEEFLRTGKRPTVIFISLEDGSKEDVNRYYSIYTKSDMAQAENAEKAYDVWHNNYGSIIDTTHVNGGEEGVNFATIDNIIKKLDEEGYFPVAVIVDSIDLMAPSFEDIRLRINDETQLLNNRARYLEKWIGDKPFPFITAHQLNRSGNQMITEKKQEGVTDIAKCLGRSMISGSYDIERRVQWSAFIYTELSKFDNEIYLEIKREKCRYRRDMNVDYLAVKLSEGFFIQDDYGETFNSCKPSIMPLDEALGGAMVGSRGVTNVNSLDKSIPETDTSKSELPPMTSVVLEASQDKGIEKSIIPINYTYILYSMLIFDGFSPFYNIENKINKKITSFNNKDWFIDAPDSCKVTPFNKK